MCNITRNLISTCHEEIQDPAEQTNLQALQKLTRGPIRFPPSGLRFSWQSNAQEKSTEEKKWQVTGI